jgi:hemoglobin-like flavoprotein
LFVQSNRLPLDLLPWLCRLFEVEPKCRDVYDFKAEDDFAKTPEFPARAKIMVDMVDLAVNYLGPDLEPLTEDLKEIGARHVNYGVEAEFLPAMVPALEYALEQVLGDKFTSDVSAAWTSVFSFMVSKMVIGLKEAQA